jgi:hypothetical protein
MASRSHSWFDAAKLLPGEQLVRSARARMRIASPPGWWEGELVLTTDRLFFLPFIDNAHLHDTAFWLDEVRAHAAGWNRLVVDTGDGQALFRIVGTISDGESAVGRLGAGWARAIERTCRAARPRPEFGDGHRHRAAG